MYQPRTYRHQVKDIDLITFTVKLRETDLCIRARQDLSREALQITQKHRASIEQYIMRHPEFLTALSPLPVDDHAPEIVKEMLLAAQTVSLGPMAAVAGAVAEWVGKELL